MKRPVNMIKRLIEQCSDQDRDEWRDEAQTILSAIGSSAPTSHGVRGAIAAAFFESSALPSVLAAGWSRRPPSPATRSHTEVFEKDGRVIRILIVIQQQKAGKPRRQYPRGERDDIYCVQVRKRPTRTHIVRGTHPEESRGNREKTMQPTRSYSFRDFDILAVNMHPVTRRWTDFRYTLSGWLIPSNDHPSLIAHEQLVSLGPSGLWTCDLATSLEWLIREQQSKAV